MSAADAPVVAWKSKATQKYLDDRAAWWLEWPRTAKGKGTTCVSCHTAVPYALARPALGKLPGVDKTSEAEKQLLARVGTRVEKWAEIVSTEPEGNDPLVPFYQGGSRDKALDTESVLNALILVGHDLRTGDQLTTAAAKALDHLWSRQQGMGEWRWLNFNLRPWELDAEYYGASLAATAVGAAGDKYPRSQTELAKNGVKKLQKYLKDNAAKQPLHNRAFGLIAVSYLKDTFSADENKAVVADLLRLQRPDGGWGLADLGKIKATADAVGWTVHTDYRNGVTKDADTGASDGYATGLVVLALKRAAKDGVAVDVVKLKKGVAWLVEKQAEDGTWPAVYINVPRNPTVDEGLFMRDAGAAYAALALAEE